MGYTTRGRGWELRQSWYLLFFLTYFLYWVPLVYAGLRVLQFRWVVWGAAYGLPFFLTLLFDPAASGADGFFRRWMFASFVVSMIHAGIARAEFLMRLEGMHVDREDAMQEARVRVDSLRRDDAPAAGQPAAPAPPARKRFDVNAIGERELAMLPGLGPERAKQALVLREGLGSFRSYGHFAEKMNLAPELRARLRPLFEDPDAAPPAPIAPTDPAMRETPDGRMVLEINLAGADSLAALPGLGDETARRAVQLRDADGPYKSLEDFRYRLGLSMDVFVAIAPLVSTVHSAPPPPGHAPGGRVIDL